MRLGCTLNPQTNLEVDVASPHLDLTCDLRFTRLLYRVLHAVTDNTKIDILCLAHWQALVCVLTMEFQRSSDSRARFPRNRLQLHSDNLNMIYLLLTREVQGSWSLALLVDFDIVHSGRSLSPFPRLYFCLMSSRK